MKIDYPLCIDCIFFDMENEYNGKPLCKAFPLGIPDVVILEKSKPHTDKSKPCTTGYRFEPNKPSE